MSEVVVEASAAPRTARRTEPSTATEAQRQRLLSRHCKRRFEFAILVTMVVIVWGLFSLPIVFFYNSSSEVIITILPVRMS